MQRLNYCSAARAMPSCGSVMPWQHWWHGLLNMAVRNADFERQVAFEIYTDGTFSQSAVWWKQQRESGMTRTHIGFSLGNEMSSLFCSICSSVSKSHFAPKQSKRSFLVKGPRVSNACRSIFWLRWGDYNLSTKVCLTCPVILIYSILIFIPLPDCCCFGSLPVCSCCRQGGCMGCSPQTR